jgi:hypothetical protein
VKEGGKQRGMRGQKCTVETENKDTMKLQGKQLKETNMRRV